MKNLEAAVVIPACREGKDILHTLASIGRSVGVDRGRIGIFVVVNQTRDAAEQVTSSNSETAEVLRSLEKRTMPEKLSDEKRKLVSYKDNFEKSFGDVWISQESAAEEFLDSGMQIEEVNLWEENAARFHCNVGLARHVGVTHAIPSLADKSCAMFNTDADVYFSRGKISAGMHTLQNNQDVHGVMGRKSSFFSMDPGEDIGKLNEGLAAYHLSAISDDLEGANAAIYSLKRKYGVKPLNDKIFRDQILIDGNLSFWGCDTNFRASVYDKAKFPYSGFGEDSELATSMWKNHLKIIEDERMLTAFSWRLSDRCTGGIGMHLLSLKADCSNLESFETQTSPRAYQIVFSTVAFIEKCLDNPSLEINEFLLEFEKIYCDLNYEQKLIAWKLYENSKEKLQKRDEPALFNLALDMLGNQHLSLKVNIERALNETLHELYVREDEILAYLGSFKRLFSSKETIGIHELRLNRLGQWIEKIKKCIDDFRRLKYFGEKQEIHKGFFGIE